MNEHNIDRMIRLIVGTRLKVQPVNKGTRKQVTE